MSGPDTLRFVSPEHDCSYLPGETASLEYRIQFNMDEDEYQALLEHGWRRHGAQFFRPACPRCSECRSLRVDVNQFRPTRSQRRCLTRNADVECVVRPASVSAEHLRLYNAWHRDMTDRRGWSLQQTTPDDYIRGFLVGEWPFAHEVQYYLAGRLVGVGLIDVLRDSISSVYFYHDPSWRPRGPGTFSILTEIDHARMTGRRHVYLGYAIRDCPSMAYKYRFGPHEILSESVDGETAPGWSRVDDPE